MRAWIVRVGTALGGWLQQMSLAGNQALRQYEQSMLPHRPEVGRNQSSFAARCTMSRNSQASPSGQLERKQSPRRRAGARGSALSMLGSVLGLAAPLLLL